MSLKRRIAVSLVLACLLVAAPNVMAGGGHPSHEMTTMERASVMLSELWTRIAALAKTGTQEGNRPAPFMAPSSQSEPISNPSANSGESLEGRASDEEVGLRIGPITDPFSQNGSGGGISPEG